MTDAHGTASTRNSKLIKATPEALYRAFTDPAALAVWLAPGDMTGEVHRFDDRVGKFTQGWTDFARKGGKLN